jgi:hypothetical protein
VKRVLIYENRKSGEPYVLDASSLELEAGAYLALFRCLDQWQVYEDLKEATYQRHLPEGHVPGCLCEACKMFQEGQKQLPLLEQKRQMDLKLYQRAANGEAAAARALLDHRNSPDSEYENFRFVTVEASTSSYPPRIWGEQKPCGEAFVCNNGLYVWGLHGAVETRLGRQTHGYGYRPGRKAALEYLTNSGILRFNAATQTQVDLGDEVWTFKPRKDGWDDGEWMYRGLCSEAEHAKTGIPLLERGSFTPGKVLRLTWAVCSSCKRDIERFA